MITARLRLAKTRRRKNRMWVNVTTAIAMMRDIMTETETEIEIGIETNIGRTGTGTGTVIIGEMIAEIEIDMNMTWDTVIDAMNTETEIDTMGVMVVEAVTGMTAEAITDMREIGIEIDIGIGMWEIQRQIIITAATETGAMAAAEIDRSRNDMMYEKMEMHARMSLEETKASTLQSTMSMRMLLLIRNNHSQ
jgi:hypothetical protein